MYGGDSSPTFLDNLSAKSSRLLKMGPIGRLERSVRNYHIMLRSDPEDSRCHLPRDGSLKKKCINVVSKNTVQKHLYVNKILSSVRQHNHFITQGNYKATCFDYRLVILRTILSIVSQDAMHTLGSHRVYILFLFNIILRHKHIVMIPFKVVC